MSELEWLRDLTDDAEPSAEQVARMRSALVDHIAGAELASESIQDAGGVAESVQQRHVAPIEKKRPHSWRLRIGAVAAATLALAAVGVGVLSNGEPATANGTGEIAHVIELIPPEDFAGATLEQTSHLTALQEFSFDDGTRIVGTQKVEYVDRLGADDLIESVRTYHLPVAADPSQQELLEEKWAAQNADMVGEHTMILTFDPEFEPLPSTVEDFDRLVRNTYAVWSYREPDADYGDDVVAPFPYFALGFVEGIYHSDIPTPPERAVMMKFLATVDGLDQETSEDSVTVTTEFDAGHALRRIALGFDRSGWMVANAEYDLIDGADEGLTPIWASEATTTPWREIDEDQTEQ